MGGGVAQAVALEGPEVLAGLVLVGTGAPLRVLPKILALTESDFMLATRYPRRRSPGAPAYGGAPRARGYHLWRW